VKLFRLFTKLKKCNRQQLNNYALQFVEKLKLKKIKNLSVAFETSFLINKASMLQRFLVLRKFADNWVFLWRVKGLIQPKILGWSCYFYAVNNFLGSPTVTMGNW
jgi:hypothetical protein